MIFYTSLICILNFHGATLAATRNHLVMVYIVMAYLVMACTVMAYGAILAVTSKYLWPLTEGDFLII